MFWAVGMGVVVAIATTTAAGTAVRAEADQVRPVRAERLPDVPGNCLTAVVTNYAPGVNGNHRHAGSVFAGVVSGEIGSENSATGLARIYRVGEGSSEPPGSEHLGSEAPVRASRLIR